MPGSDAVAWELYAHGADVGIRGRGPAPAQAFRQVALALTAAITEPASIAARIRVPVHCSAPDLQLLLYDWLNSLVFEMATRRMLFGEFEVSIEGTDLDATAIGEHVEIARHAPAVEVKGATFTDLVVAENSPGVWIAQCIIDV